MSVIRPGLQTLKTKAEFDRVFAERKRFSRDGLAFYYSAHRHDLVHLGIVAPRRYGKAVKRNRFRRRLKEIFRLYPSMPQADIVITVYRPYEELGFNLLQQTIRWGLEKIRRFSPPAAISGGQRATSLAVPTQEDR